MMTLRHLPLTAAQSWWQAEPWWSALLPRFLIRSIQLDALSTIPTAAVMP